MSSVDTACEHTLGYSTLFNKPPSFANALIQNIGGGNTMMLNRAVKNLVINAALDATVVSHDWWCCQIVTGAGGYVIYDPKPCLKYRQHAYNLVDANTGWYARLMRIRELLKGRLRTRDDINLKAPVDCNKLITKDNFAILETFMEARQLPLIKHLILLKRSGVYRQTLLGNLGLLFVIVFDKV